MSPRDNQPQTPAPTDRSDVGRSVTSGFKVGPMISIPVDKLFPDGEEISSGCAIGRFTVVGVGQATITLRPVLTPKQERFARG